MGHINKLLSGLSIEESRKSRLLRVHFDSEDPELSAKIANGIVQSYIRFHANRRDEINQESKRRLSSEIEQIKHELEESERALTVFARENNIIDLEERNNVLSEEASQLNRAYTEVRAKLFESKSVLDQVDVVDGHSLPVVLENETIRGLKAEYAQLQSEYSRLSSLFFDDYPAVAQVKQQMDSVQKNLNREIGRIVTSLKSKFNQLDAEKTMLEVALEDHDSKILDLKDRSVQYNILKREWEANKNLYSGLLKRQQEVDVAGSIETNNVLVVDSATVPLGRYKPNYSKNISVSLIGGIFGGILLALIFSYLDNSVRTSSEVEKLLQLPVLAAIPKYQKHKNTTTEHFYTVSHLDRDSAHSEAFRSLRVSLLFSSPDSTPKSILVTSATPNEGKSSIVLNLGTVLAQSEKTVLLVDADLRKPRLHKLTGKDMSPGFSTMLIDPQSTPIHQTEIDNLWVMAAGTIPPNPTELFGSNRFDVVIDLLCKKFDYVIIDSSPILGLADAIVASTKVDGTILVVSSGQVTKPVLSESVRRLRSVNAKVLGIVMNNIDMNNHNYGNYYYSYSDHKKYKKLASG